MYEHLFSSIQLRGLTLPNRVVFPAMGTRYCSDDGYAEDRLGPYHAARAAGGCGLNIFEATSVYKPGAVSKMLQISDDSYIPGLKKAVDELHAVGGLACLQLWQAGLAAGGTPGAQIVLPSDMPAGQYTIPGATVETIHACVEAYGAAAKRAVEAGFDCVEFHAAHNYSPHTFLSPAFNRRTDEYGGSPENRARYLLEAIAAIRANIPDDMPLLMRVTAQDDDLPGGLTIEDVIQFCKWAGEAGVDALDISRGNIVTAAMKYEVPPLDIPRSFNVENAARIRKETGMVTIAVGRINDPDQAEEIIASGKADMVVMGRAQIADPDFCNKAKAGRVEDIVRCVGCDQGCYDNCVADLPITCMRNPRTGREASFADTDRAKEPKKVLVIGGGVGGMEAAITAKKLGHEVILVEKAAQLGGQFLLAGRAPRKEEMAIATEQRAEQLVRAGVEVHLNTEATAALIEEIGPDAVILAIGASPIIPAIEGADGANVFDTLDILTGKGSPEGSVVVIGGGLVGLEVAEIIRSKGSSVTVVEMLDKIAKDVGPGRNVSINEHVYGSGIQVMTDTKCLRINPASVVVDHNGEEKELPADNVVIAVGSKSNDGQWAKDICASRNIPLTIIGDASEARRAVQAIHEGFDAAYAV